MYKLTSILILALAFAACSKSDSGGGTTPAADQYMNYKAGSTWNYNQTNLTSGVITNYTLTSSSSDSVINGRTYHIFNNSGGTKAFYNVTGTDYYQYDTIPGGLATGKIERLYLKTNLGAAASWTESFIIVVFGTNVTVNATNTIVAKDVTRTVNAVNYTGVIHIKTVLSIPVPGVTVTGEVNSYYAKKYGLIETTNNVSVTAFGTTQSTNTKTILLTSNLL